jgi:UDP-N-acetyl-D-mannosaminuronate dehydrogenase
LNYFKNKNKIFVFDEFVKKTKIQNVIYSKNIRELFNKADIIFICYRHQKFKILSNFASKKNKLIIDFWNYLENPKKNEKLKIIKLGIS